MSPVNQMRKWLNAHHSVAVVQLGNQLGLFKRLSDGACCSDELAASLNLNREYIRSWSIAAISSGILGVECNEILFFREGWQDALTNKNSSSYLPPMIECHLSIRETYPQFSELFQNESRVGEIFLNQEQLNGVAGDGLRFANYFLDNAVHQIPELYDKLISGIDVLDVGCGGGIFLSKIAMQFERSIFLGIDPVERAIAIANENASQFNVSDRTRFIQQCGSKLEANSADLIILNEVVHEIPKKLRLDVFKSCFKALRRNGSLFLVDILAPDSLTKYQDTMYMLAGLVQFFEFPWGSQLSTRAEIMTLLNTSGFGQFNMLIPEDNVIVGYTEPKMCV